MINTKINDDIIQTVLRFRVRFDYKTTAKPNRLFFGVKGIDKMADEIREQQGALFRNVPVQGIKIEDIDLTGDIYTMIDEVNGGENAYAPIQLVVSADSLEDMVRFIMREELRKIELIEPENMVINKNEIERVLFRMSEEVRNTTSSLIRKLGGGR